MYNENVLLRLHTVLKSIRKLPPKMKINNDSLLEQNHKKETASSTFSAVHFLPLEHNSIASLPQHATCRKCVGESIGHLERTLVCVEAVAGSVESIHGLLLDLMLRNSNGLHADQQLPPCRYSLVSFGTKLANDEIETAMHRQRRFVSSTLETFLTKLDRYIWQC